jgi:FkbM family methyltransferase
VKDWKIRAARRLLKNSGFEAVPTLVLGHWKNLEEERQALLGFPESDATRLMRLAPKSKAQLRQDLFVLSQTNFKRKGFFVDFGATNGIDLSNSFLLEAEFGWRGILAEPARCWHQRLRENRSGVVDTRCVWSESGRVLDFVETEFAELSTVQSFAASDHHEHRRKGGKTYSVETVSLADLLVEHAAPAHIDYLSIDTEGSEFSILRAFPFDRYRFGIITCEHNFTDQRESIHRLLAQHGYRRVCTEISRWDDWFVLDGMGVA